MKTLIFTLILSVSFISSSFASTKSSAFGLVHRDLLRSYQNGNFNEFAILATNYVEGVSNLGYSDATKQAMLKEVLDILPSTENAFNANQMNRIQASLKKINL